MWGHHTDKSAQAITEAAASLTASGSVDGDGSAVADAGARAIALQALMNTQLDDAERIIKARAVISPAAFLGVDALFRAGVERFPASPLLHLFVSRYYSIFRDNRFVRRTRCKQRRRNNWWRRRYCRCGARWSTTA